VSHSTSVDRIIGKESDAKDMGIDHVAKQKQLSVLKSTTTKDLYLRAIQEMFPGINTGWMSSNLTFYENWAQVRTTAASKTFINVRNMIVEKKIEYDNRTSFSDDESSDGSYASYVQKTPMKLKIDEEDEKFFTDLPTCYALFSAFGSGDISEGYCPFAMHNEGWQK
jgi:hypothetical protein